MKEITIKIDQIEGNLATFQLNDDKIAWPIKELPDDLRVGDSVVFRVLKTDEARSLRDKSAKELLNELLDNDEKS